jgi:hypothetical protein
MKLLKEYREVREKGRRGCQKTDVTKLDVDMLSDLSYFGSDKGRSDLTTSTENEHFYSKWE